MTLLRGEGGGVRVFISEIASGRGDKSPKIAENCTKTKEFPKIAKNCMKTKEFGGNYGGGTSIFSWGDKPKF